MRKLPSSGYVCADDSKQPGYLASRFKKMQAEQRAREAKAAEAIRQQAEIDAANAAEAESKTVVLPRIRAKA